MLSKQRFKMFDLDWPSGFAIGMLLAEDDLPQQVVRRWRFC
jgi:hypothetical protein